MICLIKFIFFIGLITIYGFITLSQITKLKTLLLLIPISFTFGISTFLAICHILSFFIGPKISSYISLLILLIIALLTLFCKYRKFNKPELEISKINLLTILVISSVISILSFFAINRTGPLDNNFHTSLTLTLYHNNIYPPKDFFKPEYLLLYHFGGDLLTGAIYHICKIDISRSFEYLLALLSGITFLSFFSLAWILTKNYRTSLIASFCTYFGGGLLWLDAIFRFLFKNLPDWAKEWSLIQTFLNLGIHGAINNAPSVFALVPTFGTGVPILILCLILFGELVKQDNLKRRVHYIIPLSISLLALFLSAEWLYLTFWTGTIIFAFILLLKNQKEILITTLIVLVISLILSITTGSLLFMQDPIQHLGRANIFNVSIKDELFWITTWGRLTSTVMNYQKVCIISWDFIAEFGLSLLLFPIAIIYLIKSKNNFALLLFLCAATTMPLPMIIDFKTNPADFNRLFAFGNAMIILLITCGIGILYKSLFKRWLFIIIYTVTICLSPLTGLISSAIFTHYITVSKTLVQLVLEEGNKIKSPNNLIQSFLTINKELTKSKNIEFIQYKDEIKFLRLNSKPNDVGISSVSDLPLYAGVYSIIPGHVRAYKDQLYSSFDNIYRTVFDTLDLNLINELNIKWIIINNKLKDTLPSKIQALLNNKDYFKLVYHKNDFEIYHIKNIKKYFKNYDRKFAWVLSSGTGQLVEPVLLHLDKITLFPSSRDALLYLKSLHGNYPALKKELVTAQTIIIQSLEKQIVSSNLNVKVEKRF